MEESDVVTVKNFKTREKNLQFELKSEMFSSESL